MCETVTRKTRQDEMALGELKEEDGARDCNLMKATIEIDTILHRAPQISKISKKGRK